MAFTIILACFLILSVSYRSITRHILPGLLKPDDKRSTPARRYMDGKETLPVPSPLLTAFHFQGITLDPLISPVIALQFGWFPAIVWILIGTLVWGWLQSYLVAVISIRSGGSNLIDLFDSLINRRAYKLFTVLLFFILFPLIGHFVSLTSILVNRTSTLPAVIFTVVISLLAGYLIFRWRLNTSLSILACFLLLYVVLYTSATGAFAEEVAAINSILGGNGDILLNRVIGGGAITYQLAFWSFIVLVLISAAAALPVWKLAIPFNFITGFFSLILIILSLIGIGIGYSNGTLTQGFEIPALTGLSRDDLGPIWPILFTLLTSGSISGWQALVASQSTVHMVEKESRLLPVSIGAQLISAFLVILVIVLGGMFGVSSGGLDPDHGYHLVAGPASVAAYGLQKVLELVGLPGFLADKAGLFLLTFAYLSALQLGVRYSRQLLAWSFGHNIPVLKNPLSGSFLIAGATYVFILLGLWQWLWPLFGGSALIISGFVLMYCAFWLTGQGKRARWLIWSGIFLLITGSTGILYESVFQAAFKNLLLNLDQNPGEILGNLVKLFSGGIILVTTGMLAREFTRISSRYMKSFN